MDETRFEQYFREHFQALVGFAMWYVPDSDTASEIVQEVFINFWNKRDTISPDQNIKSYLYISVKNRCLNFIRDNKKFRSYFLDVELEMDVAVSVPDKLEQSEVALQIENAFGKLPEKCRQVFELSRLEEMKYREIAEKLNISVKTVEAQMSKALKILSSELKGLLIILILIWVWIIRG